MFLPISIAQIPECGWFQPHGKNVKAVHAWGSPSSHFWRGCNICKKIEATRQPERTGAKLMPSEFHQEKIGNSTPERFFPCFSWVVPVCPYQKKKGSQILDIPHTHGPLGSGAVVPTVRPGADGTASSQLALFNNQGWKPRRNLTAKNSPCVVDKPIQESKKKLVTCNQHNDSWILVFFQTKNQATQHIFV